MGRFFKSFIIALLIIVILAAALGFYYFSGNINVADLPSFLFGGEEESQFENNEITFAMLGVDVLEANEYKGTRTDTIMIVKCNFDDGSLKILSIPRDTRVYVNGKKDKINHAHSYGGVDMALESINDFLETNIKYYVKIDYRAVKEVVDAIGGVDINVPRRMEYYDPTVDFRVDLQEGQQVLNGDQAMQFLRWRKNNDYSEQYEEGDVGRIHTQQYFLKEFVKQALSLKNIFKLPKIVNTYFERVDTNIPLKQILAGMNLARKLDTENIRTETVPGDGKYIKGVSYFVYDETGLANLLIDMGLR